MGAIIVAANLSGCGKVIDEGNFGIEKHWGGEYNSEVHGQGWVPNVWDTMYEVYGREMLITIQNAQPKDKDKAKLQDLDLTISVTANKKNAVPFLLKTGDLVEKDGNILLGYNILTKDAQSMIGETVKKFSSEELLNDKKAVENAFQKDLQSELDKLYGKETFTVKEVKFGNILAAEFIEQKQQAIALLNAEAGKNEATMRVVESRQKALIAEAKVLSEAASQGNITVDQLLTYETIKVLRENPNQDVKLNMDVKNSPKP